MGTATLLGLVAAILLIASLMFGAADVLVPKQPVITTAGVLTSMLRFALVIRNAPRSSGARPRHRRDPTVSQVAENRP